MEGIDRAVVRWYEELQQYDVTVQCKKESTDQNFPANHWTCGQSVCLLATSFMNVAIRHHWIAFRQSLLEQIQLRHSTQWSLALCDDGTHCFYTVIPYSTPISLSCLLLTVGIRLVLSVWNGRGAVLHYKIQPIEVAPCFRVETSMPSTIW